MCTGFQFNNANVWIRTLKEPPWTKLAYLWALASVSMVTEGAAWLAKSGITFLLREICIPASILKLATQTLLRGSRMKVKIPQGTFWKTLGKNIPESIYTSLIIVYSDWKVALQDLIRLVFHIIFQLRPFHGRCWGWNLGSCACSVTE